MPILNLMRMAESSPNRYKTLWEKEKLFNRLKLETQNQSADALTAALTAAGVCQLQI